MNISYNHNNTVNTCFRYLTDEKNDVADFTILLRFDTQENIPGRNV